MSQQINLYNPIFRQQKKYLSAVTMAQALAMILLGSLLLTGYAAYRTNRIQAEAMALTTQLADAQKMLARIDAEYPTRQRSKALENEIRRTETDMQSLQKVAQVLQQGELGNTEGYAGYFRGVARQIIDGVWLTGLSIHGGGTEMELKGRALNPELVPVYIGRLKSEPALQGKSFSRLEMQAPQQTGTGKGEAATSTVSYIEFSLQSTGMAGQDKQTGMNNK